MALARSAIAMRPPLLAALGCKQRQTSASVSESGLDGAAPVGKLALPRAELLALQEEVSVARGVTYVDHLARNSRTDGQTQSWPLLGDTGDRGFAAAADSSDDG
jgi:hypothetical protein